jgi:hypothetical protein
MLKPGLAAWTCKAPASLVRIRRWGETHVHIFIDFGQLCSLKPTTHVHGNRTVVFMISTTRFHPGQHT